MYIVSGGCHLSVRSLSCTRRRCSVTRRRCFLWPGFLSYKPLRVYDRFFALLNIFARSRAPPPPPPPQCSSTAESRGAPTHTTHAHAHRALLQLVHRFAAVRSLFRCNKRVRATLIATSCASPPPPRNTSESLTRCLVVVDAAKK